mgnify:FL=1|jgi:ribonuclease-3 family protein
MEGMNCPLTDLVRVAYGLRQQDIRTYSPLTLAYIGDAIYDLIIRTMLVEKGNSQVNKLHKRASGFVKASAQKQAMEAIEPLLTPEEHGYYKRGRNAKSFTTAKNASIAEYRIATGFEALIGFLYLTGRMERLMELVKYGTDALLGEDFKNPEEEILTEQDMPEQG